MSPSIALLRSDRLRRTAPRKPNKKSPAMPGFFAEIEQPLFSAIARYGAFTTTA